MDANLINPFIEALYEMFQTMMQTTPERSAPFLQENSHTESDISGIIGFVGPQVAGSVALCLSKEAAIELYELTMGESVNGITNEVKDMVGEFANIIAGTVKKKMASQELSFHISIPTIVIGSQHAIHHKLDTPVLVIPFTIDEHPFYLKVSMKILKNKG
ncbi:MAG: chemotaxis protein CheX [bacterium]|nr:chemotaxis protein CheX [bacterium]